MSATDAGEQGRDPVGSLADEFTKLLGALSGCLGDHREEGPVEDASDDVGSGGHPTECRWCPLCRTVHAVRDVSPEVKEHLRSAGVSLLHAVSGLVAAVTAEAQAGEKQRPRPRPSTGIEHIDLDDNSGGPGEET